MRYLSMKSSAALPTNRHRGGLGAFNAVISALYLLMTINKSQINKLYINNIKLILSNFSNHLVINYYLVMGEISMTQDDYYFNEVYRTIDETFDYLGKKSTVLPVFSTTPIGSCLNPSRLYGSSSLIYVNIAFAYRTRCQPDYTSLECSIFGSSTSSTPSINW